MVIVTNFTNGGSRKKKRKHAKFTWKRRKTNFLSMNYIKTKDTIRLQIKLLNMTDTCVFFSSLFPELSDVMDEANWCSATVAAAPKRSLWIQTTSHDWWNTIVSILPCRTNGGCHILGWSVTDSFSQVANCSRSFGGKWIMSPWSHQQKANTSLFFTRHVFRLLFMTMGNKHHPVTINILCLSLFHCAHVLPLTRLRSVK